MRRVRPEEADAGARRFRHDLGALCSPEKAEKLKSDIADDWALLSLVVDKKLLNRFERNLRVSWSHQGMLVGFERGWAAGRYLLKGAEQRRKEPEQLAWNRTLTNPQLCRRLDERKIPLPERYAEALRRKSDQPSWELAYILTPKLHPFEEHLRQLRMRAETLKAGLNIYRQHVLPRRKLEKSSKSVRSRAT